MNNKMLIGIGGGLGQGKSTIATMLGESLQNQLPEPWTIQIIPFAKGVKDIARTFGWFGEKDKKGRRLLQLIGTECGRQCVSPDIWVEKWLAACRATPPYTVIIADDMRFANEAKAIQIETGMLVLVSHRKRVWKPKFLRHKSEKGLPVDCYHKRVPNDKTLRELQFEVNNLTTEILEYYGMAK